MMEADTWYMSMSSTIRYIIINTSVRLALVFHTSLYLGYTGTWLNHFSQWLPIFVRNKPKISQYDLDYIDG